jgi:hypothetical protein
MIRRRFGQLLALIDQARVSGQQPTAAQKPEPQ